LKKGGRGGFADQDQRNITIARQRLAELKEQLQAGALSQELYNEQLAELELALSDDLEIESPVKASQSSGRWMAPVLIFAIPLMAGSFYLALGNYQLINQEDQPTASNQATSEQEQISKMVGGLAERLKEQPDDALGWTMLGRSYKYLQQYPKAVEAFEHAYKLIGDKPEIMLLYADALAFANNEQMAGKPAELVFKALTMEPNNVTGLWLGGMAKAQTGDFAAAMDLWKKLEAQLPAGSEAQQEIQGLLVKLAAQIPEGAAAQPSKTVSIDVQVSLAPELQKSASPKDTVFIYAQALSGPKMPLAIVRKQVSELPLTVSLTDAMAMMPNMKLSNFEQVKLLARVSKSGDAMQQPGDLIGTIEQVSLADKTPHKIVINSQIK
jgi:cytochrome c-type biogenesis protein CcmH